MKCANVGVARVLRTAKVGIHINTKKASVQTCTCALQTNREPMNDVSFGP